MISRWLVLVLCIAVVSPSLLRAQQQPSPSPAGANSTAPLPRSADIRFPINSTNYDKMYEDIEILRRILDRKFTPLYPSETCPMAGGRRGVLGRLAGIQGGMNVPGTPYLNLAFPINNQDPNSFLLYNALGDMNPIVIPLRSLEGVYLKGQGVVYTVTLSSLQPPSEAKAAKPVSEWESARRQVRNEKEEPKKPEANKSPSLSDVLLKVLAENGHHFSQLGENESLSLVITVHDKGQSTEAPKSKGGSAKKSSSSPKSGGGSDLRGELRDIALLGDLHLKQGKAEEALAAFNRALEMNPDPKQAVALYRKAAQAHLMQGQDRKAQIILERVISLNKESADAKDKPTPAAKPALPVKLIVSAPKELLDEAKEGKIPFEEFRRRARVEKVGTANNSR